MTNFPDSESLKVCPGHIPELECTIHLTTDSGLNTIEGEALPPAGWPGLQSQKMGTGQEALVHQEGRPSLLSYSPCPAATWPCPASSLLTQL